MTDDVRYHRINPIDFRLRKNQLLRVEVFQRDEFACQGCGWSTTEPPGYDGRYTIGPWPHRAERTLHMDHVVPRHRGGPNDADNLQTLCEPCNCSKAGRAA